MQIVVAEVDDGSWVDVEKRPRPTGKPQAFDEAIGRRRAQHDEDRARQFGEGADRLLPGAEDDDVDPVGGRRRRHVTDDADGVLAADLLGQRGRRGRRSATGAEKGELRHRAMIGGCERLGCAPMKPDADALAARAGQCEQLSPRRPTSSTASSGRSTDARLRRELQDTSREIQVLTRSSSWR